MDDLEFQQEEELECNYHLGSKGNFYCDDCRVFLCKVCFANEHRTHNSNLPSDIALSFKRNVQSLIDNISKYEPRIEDSLKVINDLETRIKSIRESSFKKLNDIVGNIKTLFAAKNQLFMEEYMQILDSTDEDISDVNQRLKALHTRIRNSIAYAAEIKTFIKKNKNDNPLEICDYKQKQSKFFSDAVKIFSECKFLISSKVEMTIKKAEEKIKQFNEIRQSLYKKIKIFSSSIINSIQTGISSFSIRVRRFTKFFKTGIKYYKTSSLKFRTNSPVSIVGFSVCGLISDTNTRRNHFNNSNPNERSSSITNTNNTNNNINNNKNNLSNSNISDQHTSHSVDHNNNNKMNISADGSSHKNNLSHHGPNTKADTKVKNSNTTIHAVNEYAEISIPFSFSIREMKSDDMSSTEELISENFTLREIKNPVDPTLSFYLNKSINISPEKKYVITITNLNGEVYLDLWSGEVSKYFINLMTQAIKCNSSHIKFEFTPPEGIESDFNEFNCGIISDLIYSYKEEK